MTTTTIKKTDDGGDRDCDRGGGGEMVCVTSGANAIDCAVAGCGCGCGCGYGCGYD
jgi:hypothetical protein